MSRWEPLFVAAVALGMVVVAQWTHDEPRPTVPIVQEVDEIEASKVSEAEFNVYIEVYKEMQADHDVSLDDALARRNESLVRFRDIERRVQAEQKLVDRVRLALLTQAKERAGAGMFGRSKTEASAAPTPPSEP